MQLKGKIYKIDRTEMKTVSFTRFRIETSTKKSFVCQGKCSCFLGEYVILEGDFNKYGHFDFTSFIPNFSSIEIRKEMLFFILYPTSVTKAKTLFNILTDAILEATGRMFKTEEEQEEFAISTIFDIFMRKQSVKLITHKIKPEKIATLQIRWDRFFGFYMFWKEMQTFQMDTLSAYAIFTNKVFQKNVSGNIKRIKDNPYEILMLTNMSFQKIDNFVESCKNDTRRIYGAIIASVKEEFEKGNNFQEEKEILNSSFKKLTETTKKGDDVSMEEIQNQLNLLIKEKRLHKDLRGNIYLERVFEKEEEIRKFVIANKNVYKELPNLDKIITAYETEKKMKFGAQQKDGIKNCLSHKLSLLCGMAGTGKTSTLSAILYFYMHNFGINKDEIRLCAPTGKASQRMMETIEKNLGVTIEASTIHVLLKPIGNDDDNFIHNALNKLSGKLFVCDESSMIDHNIAYHFISALPENAIVIFIGDTGQLPAVKGGDFLRDLKESGVSMVELTETFRQKGDSKIIDISHSVRNNTLIEQMFTKEEGKKANEFNFVGISKYPFEKQIKLITSVYLRAIKVSSIEDTIVLSPLKSINENRNTLNTKVINNSIQASVLPDKDGEVSYERNGEKFKVGSRIIITKNNYDINVINGDIGYIESIDLSNKCVMVKLDRGLNVSLEAEDLDHLQLAYAVTVHKSQGSEWKNVIYICNNDTIMNNRNLAYTAITRAKKNCLIMGDKKTFLKAPQIEPVQKKSRILN